MPGYCKVDGVIAPALRFEVRLPANWNGKLYYGGGGGYNGTIPPAIARPLAQGYAEVASDSGHQGDGMSAAFIANNPLAAELFGSKSVPTVMAVALKVVDAAYGRRPARSYFEGCSTGGREALMVVQRNPALFDGVIVRAPAYNWVGLMGEFNRVARALAAPGGAFPPAKTALLAAHVRKSCDGLDGIVDGVVANPFACTARRLNLAALRCPGGKNTGNTCLSDGQLAVVRAWTTGVSYANGAYTSQGYNLTGNEDDPMNFRMWAAGDGDVRKGAQYAISDSTLKYYLAGDPHAESLNYTPWDKDRAAIDRMAALNDATRADIRPFLDHGGKLIVWHGGADAGLSVNATIDYVERMRAAVGRSKADASTRLYVAPGVNHCEGGPGADDADLLTAIDQWVTEGRAPGTLTAVKLDAGGTTVFSRPLCEYPEYPRYTRRAGDAAARRAAASYVCTAPSTRNPNAGSRTPAPGSAKAGRSRQSLLNAPRRGGRSQQA
jgi:feruloyl esterase